MKVFLVLLVMVLAGCQTQTIDDPASQATPITDASEYIVTYNLSSSLSNNHREGVYKLYVKGENSKDEITDEFQTTEWFKLGDKSYYCQGADTPVCYEWVQNESQGFSMILDKVRDSWRELNFTTLPQRNVLGMTADCVGYLEGDTSFEACYTEDGIPLYIYANPGAGEMKLVAAGVSYEVSDEDFILPDPSPAPLPVMPS